MSNSCLVRTRNSCSGALLVSPLWSAPFQRWKLCLHSPIQKCICWQKIHKTAAKESLYILPNSVSWWLAHSEGNLLEMHLLGRTAFLSHPFQLKTMVCSGLLSSCFSRYKSGQKHCWALLSVPSPSILWAAKAMRKEIWWSWMWWCLRGLQQDCGWPEWRSYMTKSWRCSEACELSENLLVTSQLLCHPGGITSEPIHSLREQN